MSKIMQIAAIKNNNIKYCKTLRNKISFDNKASKKNISPCESQEILKNEYSPIRLSKTLKQEEIISLINNTNSNMKSKNSDSKLKKDDKKSNNSKEKYKNPKSKIHFKKVLNSKNSTDNLNSEKNIIKKKELKKKTKKSDLVGGVKINGFYKILNNIDHDDQVVNDKEIRTSRNNENSMKGLNTENNKSHKFSKKINQIYKKLNEINEKQDFILDTETEIKNTAETDRNSVRIVNFPNLEKKNPFFNDNNKSEKNKTIPKNNSVMKSSVGTMLNSSTSESCKNNTETAYSNKVIPFVLPENQQNISNNKNDEEQNNNNTSLYNDLLNSIKNSDINKFNEIYNKILQLPKESNNFNYQDASGYSALHYSSELGNLKMVELLIKAKCNINIKTKENKTPLHLSAIKGKYDIFKFLIENNADINIYDTENNSPLHYICLHNHLNLLKYILEKNPDIETKNTNGKKPSELTSNKEMISLLKEFHNQKNSSNNDSKNEDNIIISNNIKKNYYNGIPKIYIKEKKSSELSEKYKKIKIDNKINEKHECKTTREYTRKENMINSSKQVNNFFRESKDSNINNQSYLKNNLKVMKALFNNSNNADLNKSNKVENLMNISKHNISLNKFNINMNNSHNKKKNKIRNKKDILSSHLVNTYLTEDDPLQTSNNIKHHSKEKIIRESTKTVHFNLIDNIMSKKTKDFNSKMKENFDIYDKINHKKSKEKSKENPSGNSNKSNKKNQSNKRISQQKIKNTSRNIDLINGLRPHNSTQGLSYFVDNKMKINHKENHMDSKTSKNLNMITEERISLSSFVSLAILGRGSFGEVYLVQKIDTQKKYAMKVLNKDRILAQNLLKYVRAERNILSIMNHPYIIKLYYAFQTNSKLFLILEYCPGGDLSKHLYFEKKFSEQRAKIYICEVLLALENLHKKNIIYRDLKPDNVVLCDDGHCKLTDFGLSKEGVLDGNAAKSFCGSIAYLAPEMLQKKGHGKAVDWYLLGVLLYEMIIGVTPFFSNSKEQIFYNIENEKLVIPDYVSKEAADLIRKLLERNPNKRLGSSHADAEEIKKEPFFKDINWNDVYNKTIKAPFKNNYNFSSIHYFKSPKLFVKDSVDKLNENYIEDWSFVDESET